MCTIGHQFDKGLAVKGNIFQAGTHMTEIWGEMMSNALQWRWFVQSRGRLLEKEWCGVGCSLQGPGQ